MSVAEAGSVTDIDNPATNKDMKRVIASPRSLMRATIVEAFCENCDAFINSIRKLITARHKILDANNSGKQLEPRSRTINLFKIFMWSWSGYRDFPYSIACVLC